MTPATFPAKSGAATLLHRQNAEVVFLGATDACFEETGLQGGGQAEFQGEENQRPFKKVQMDTQASKVAVRDVTVDADSLQHNSFATGRSAFAASAVALLNRSDLNAGMAQPQLHRKQVHRSSLFVELFTMAEKLEQFRSIENETAFKTRELVALVSQEVVSERMSEVSLRGLDDEQVFASLLSRKQSMTHIDNEVKVQDSMLQLFRVLMRRKVAVLSGHRLPPLDSVFAK